MKRLIKNLTILFTILLLPTFAFAQSPIRGGPITYGGGGVATDVLTDTTNFDGALSAADTTIQAALDTLDDTAALIRFETIEKTTDATLTVLECSDTLITNRGWTGGADMTLTLPDADTDVGAGLKFKFLVVVTDAAEDIYIDTEGATTNIYLDGTPGADGHRIWTDNPTIGESIVCHTATIDGTAYDWFCDSINGIWADFGS